MKKSSQSIAGHIVVGKHAARALLSKSPNRIRKVFITKDSNEGKADELFHKAKSLRKVEIQELSNDAMSSLAGTQAHQGIILEASPPEFVSLDDLIESLKGEGGLLILDSIFDPHNFGTLLRAAECFGVKGVIWSKNRGSSLTPVATKASVGASELLSLCPVSNIAQAIRTLKSHGIWIVSSSIRDDAIPLPKLDVGSPWGLVVGSEGEGISKLIEDLSDYIVEIPLFGATQSLNVSQAASVILYEMTKKR